MKVCSVIFKVLVLSCLYLHNFCVQLVPNLPLFYMGLCLGVFYYLRGNQKVFCTAAVICEVKAGKRHSDCIGRFMCHVVRKKKAIFTDRLWQEREHWISTQNCVSFWFYKRKQNGRAVRRNPNPCTVLQPKYEIF